MGYHSEARFTKKTVRYINSSSNNWHIKQIDISSDIIDLEISYLFSISIITSPNGHVDITLVSLSDNIEIKLKESMCEKIVLSCILNEDEEYEDNVPLYGNTAIIEYREL